MNLPKQLIVNADDFGQSKGINEGIITAHEQGIVTSASLMVRYEHANDAAKLSLRNEELSVGLHVDL
ncbi:MAG TPA: ChbG/HpnK family deacetylase, partial [Ferruginibacter sp.]|nr:ChbG/HpnK family deacetylase [Ferruginibacter sp.]